MILFLGFAGLLMIPLGIYVYVLIRRFLEFWFGDRKWVRQKLVSVIAALLITIPCINLFSLWALLVAYFAAASVCLDIVRLVAKKAGIRYGRWWHGARAGGLAAALAVALATGYGYFNMGHVVATRYTVSTSKQIRPEGNRLVFVSDLHFETTMGLDKLQAYCDRMEAEEPDLVVLGGDIVDEATSLQGVKETFEALAGISSTYGTFYVYGNHDKGRYARDCDFTQEQLAELITASGVKILEDQSVALNGELSITGRRDRSDAGRDQLDRLPSGQLLERLPLEGYHILADHQPRDMEENAEAGYDLMVSGHTHGGQMWPVGLVTTLSDHGTVNYGRRSYGAMKLIVSSGIAGWGYPLRTGKHSEYVVVNICQAEGE